VTGGAIHDRDRVFDETSIADGVEQEHDATTESISALTA
jgi:hypothetical protein